jgi:methanogenic corrinoid protein MtbC1
MFSCSNMSATQSQAAAETGGRLSIGALSRATGIPIETLRTWERRYGFPVPERKPSGHRVYPLSSIDRLRRIAEALSRGHRAHEAVSASETELGALLAVTPLAISPSAAAPSETPAEIVDYLQAVEIFDAEQLTQLLMKDWKRLKPIDFLKARIAPLLRAVGDAWAAGQLEIRHEHFVSERVGDVLRALRLPFEERSRGPLVVCGTLSGEPHGLGLQMVALLLAVEGCRILYLGTQVPPAQIAGLTKDRQARAVAVSVSGANGEEKMTAQLELVRGMLPRQITLLVGGDGAPGTRPGMTVLKNLADLATWSRRLVAAAS